MLISSVNVARRLVPNPAGFRGVTGIDKRPVTGRVEVRDDQVVGDRVNDARHHGGRDQAVYAYAREDAAWWAAELGRELLPGSFGENLSTEGVAVTDAVIGERWSVGSAVLEVSCPRIPCRVFGAFLAEDKWIKRFTDRAWPGAYLRIITAGDIGAGDPVTVTHRPDHGVTIGEAFRCITGDHSLAAHVVTAEELPAKALVRLRSWADAGAPAFPLDAD